MFVRALLCANTDKRERNRKLQEIREIKIKQPDKSRVEYAEFSTVFVVVMALSFCLKISGKRLGKYA